MGQPLFSRRRKIGVSCLVLLLATGCLLWLARDIPRHVIAAVLSNRLAARVHVSRLDLQGRKRAVLAGVEIEKFRDYPFIERLTIEELVVDGSLEGALESRFERLRFRGVEARLVAASAVDVPDRPLPIIAELIVEPARILFLGSGSGSEASLTAEMLLRGIGTDLTGEVGLHSPDLLLAPFVAVLAPSPSAPVTGRLLGLDASLRIDADRRRITVLAAAAELAHDGSELKLSEPRLAAEVGSGALTGTLEVPLGSLNLEGQTLPLADSRVAISATPSADGGGTWRFEILPRLPWLESGSLAGEWDPARRRLVHLDSRLHGLELARLLPSLGLDTAVDVVLQDHADLLDYSVEAMPQRLDLPGGLSLAAADGTRLTARLSGNLPFERLASLQAPIWDGPLQASLEADAGTGRLQGLDLPASLFPLSASFDGRWQNRQGFQLDGESRLETAGAGNLSATGEIAVAADASTADLAWTWSKIRLAPLLEMLHHAGFPAPPLAVAGIATASGSLRGPLTGPVLRAEVRVEALEVSPVTEDPAASWRLFAAQASASGSWEVARSPISIRSLHVGGELEAPGWGPLPVDLTAAGWSAADGSRGELAKATFESPRLGTTRIAGEWRRPGEGVEATAVVSLENLDLARWQDTLAPRVDGGMLAGYALAGTVSADWRLALGRDGAWRLEGPVDLAAAGFASADGSEVTQGLEGHWTVTVDGAPGAATEARAAGRIGGFLLLWNTFFGDFSDTMASLTLSGRREPAGDGELPPWRIEASASVPEGPAVEASFEGLPAPASDGVRYTISLEDADLAATHRRYLAALLEERLGRMDLGGALAASGRGTYHPAAGDRSRSWSLLGELKLQGFSLASGGGQAEVAGLHLELPLELRQPAAGADLSGPRLAGRLAFERLDVRGLELPPTRTDLWVEADSVGLEEPIELAILEGTLVLESLTLRQLLRPARHLETGIRLTGISLEGISRAMEIFPLEGALDGRFPVVRLSPARLQVEGGGQVELFGGTVRLLEISGEDVLTRFPKIKLSADFENIDLGRLTRRIDFGEMKGVLQGSLTDCELFRGVPVRFSARLETVTTKGVPRTVDVKAVNNLTILGTGQGTNIFDRGLRKFLDKYNYERLGITLRLDNDVLLLRGLEHRGGKELFLRGRLPFRIDVVNAQPGKTVSFQTMTRRLKSLDFARATSKP